MTDQYPHLDPLTRALIDFQDPADVETYDDRLARTQREREARDYRKVPFPVLPSYKRGRGWCRWCGEQILYDDGPKKGEINTRRQWHPDCVDDYRCHTPGPEQRGFVLERDGKKCAICGVKAMKWLAGDVSEILDVEAEQLVSRHKPYTGPWYTERDQWRRRNSYRYTPITWTLALEIDHIVPLWKIRRLPEAERRVFYGPENLWALCPAHHAEKTRQEAKERAAAARSDFGETHAKI